MTEENGQVAAAVAAAPPAPANESGTPVEPTKCGLPKGSNNTDTVASGEPWVSSTPKPKVPDGPPAPKPTPASATSGQKKRGRPSGSKNKTSSTPLLVSSLAGAAATAPASTGQKKRGRPVGSKNKPKEAATTPVASKVARPKAAAVATTGTTASGKKRGRPPGSKNKPKDETLGQKKGGPASKKKAVAAEPSAKKPRGRPARTKTEPHGAAAAAAAAAVGTPVSGKKRGRPAGSKNKPKCADDPSTKKPRSRPAGTATIKEDVIPYGWERVEVSKGPRVPAKPLPPAAPPSVPRPQRAPAALPQGEPVPAESGDPATTQTRKIFTCKALKNCSFASLPQVLHFDQTLKNFLAAPDKYQHKPGPDPNDDDCLMCKGGGTLLCCDFCRASIHGACCGMKVSVIPANEYFKCPFCCWREWLEANPNPVVQ